MLKVTKKANEETKPSRLELEVGDIFETRFGNLRMVIYVNGVYKALNIDGASHAETQTTSYSSLEKLIEAYSPEGSCDTASKKYDVELTLTLTERL